MNTEKDKILTDPEAIKKDNERFEELKKKKEEELTPDEKKEVGEIKERYGARMQKKVDELTWRAKTAEERASEAERKAEEREARLRELEKKPEVKPKVKDDVTEIDGKKFYTDESLKSMIDAGEITEAEAYSYQQKRMKAEVKAEVMSEIDKKERDKTDRDIRMNDAKDIIKKYPHFSKEHPDFNANDPLYKLSTEIYMEGYAANPRGLSLSIKRAKEILRVTDHQPDRTDDFELEDNTPPERHKGRKEKDVTLSETEKEQAIRTFTRGDVVNPKTNRPYTQQEAINKALEAKKSRLRKE